MKSTNHSEFIINIDYLDMVWFYHRQTGKLYLQDEIHRLAEAMAKNGIRKANWRVSCCGQMAYYSDVELRAGSTMSASKPPINAVMQLIDPLKVATEILSQYEIECYAWMTLFDDFLPICPSKLYLEEPHLQWVDRTGTIFCPGIFSLSWPAVFDHKLAIIQELSEYDIQGVMISFRSHSAMSCPYREKDFFGYETPIQKEFQKRYGIDIRKVEEAFPIKNEIRFADKFEFEEHENFNRDLWHKLKGEYLTSWLREVKKLLNKRELRLMLTVNQKVEGPREFARLYHDYPTWQNEKLVDELAVTQWIERNKNQPLIPEPQDFWNGPIYLWTNIDSTQDNWNYIEQYRKALAPWPNIRGLLLHEAASFEFGLHVPGLNLKA